MAKQNHLPHLINKLIQQRNLTSDEMVSAFSTIMNGGATDAQIGGFLIALRMKGETVEEISAAAEVMRALSSKVVVRSSNAVDIVGTGGDSLATFNVSTASMFVAAAAGVVIAKHGNRSVSSRSGSADLLEAAGINLAISSEQVAECIDQVGIGFMFALTHHSAMRFAIGPRKEMGVRTIFNLLGPLTNPAGVKRQVLGVFNKQWVLPIAKVLHSLGSEHVMVVHADDGMDEISVTSPTSVAELKAGTITEYQLSPTDFSMNVAPIESIQVDSPEASLAMIRSVFANEASAARDIVAMNAGAAIYVAGLADSHLIGVEKALAVLANGSAQKKMDELVVITQKLGN